MDVAIVEHRGIGLSRRDVNGKDRSVEAVAIEQVVQTWKHVEDA
jgi:hypothetical protein